MESAGPPNLHKSGFHCISLPCERMTATSCVASSTDFTSESSVILIIFDRLDNRKEIS